jgi:hypothetical protein
MNKKTASYIENCVEKLLKTDEALLMKKGKMN